MNIELSYPFTFYNEIFSIYYTSTRQWFIPITQICDALGIDARSQRRRVATDPVLESSIANLEVETSYADESTVTREMVCINLNKLPYFLGTLNVRTVKEEAKSKIILFKREFAEAAWSLFRSDIIPSEILLEMDSHLPPEYQKYNLMMDRMNEMRKNILVLQSEVNNQIEDAMANVMDQISQMSDRLGKIEENLGDAVRIDTGEQHLIKQMVAEIVEVRFATNRHTSKSQHFALTYGEFYKKFKIPAYAALPAKDFDDAVIFLLNKWKAYAAPGTELPEAFSKAQPQSKD